MMPKANWSRRFDEPIVVDKLRFVTLLDAATYITKLKKRVADLPKWQVATRILIETAEGRCWIMGARTAMLKALLPPDPPIEHTGSSGDSSSTSGTLRGF